MAVPFGFSIGDFIAGINLVFDVYDALRESGGAASDYREHIAWLQQLVTVLEALKNSTPDDVAQMARECEAPLVEFRNKIRLKYNDTLGEGSRLSPGKVLRSLQWTFFKSASKDAGKLRTAIGPQSQAITLRLGLQARDATARIGAQMLQIQQSFTSNQTETSIHFETIHRTVVDQARQLQGRIQTTADTIRSDAAQSEGRLANKVTAIGETLSQTRQIAEEIRGETSAVNETIQSLLRQKPTAITDALYGPLFSSLKEVVKEALQEEKLQSGFGNAMSIDTGRKASILIQSRTLRADGEGNVPIRAQTLQDPEFPTIRRQQTFTKISGEYDLSRETSPNRYTVQPTQKSVKRRTLGFGSLRMEITKVTSESTQNTRIDLTFHPAMWTFHKGALITLQRISRVFQGRTITIKPNTFNVVCMDSEIFDACRNLDLDTIQDLFLAKKASPFDRDEHGGSLLDWTLQALLEGHENIQPDNFQGQRLIEILRLLLDSGLRFEPKPAHPRIKSTDLQIFLSSGQLLTLGERVSVPILDPWMAKWNDISASIFFSLSTNALNDIYFRLDITEFLRRNMQTLGTYVYFEHNLASVYWVGQLQEQMYARLYQVQPKRALAALIESDDFAEACAPRSVLQVDEHLYMLQRAVHEKSPTWSWGMHAVARFLSKGRRFSRLEMQELSYCAERYGISEFWKTVITMAEYPEDVANILDLDEQTARSKIPGEWPDLDEQEEWQDLIWSGRCYHDEDEIAKDEVEENPSKKMPRPMTKVEKVRRVFKMMKKGKRLKRIRAKSCSQISQRMQFRAGINIVTSVKGMPEISTNRLSKLRLPSQLQY